MQKIKFLAFLALIIVSCNSKVNIEEKASEYLERARNALVENKFDEAKKEIVEMRKTYPKAFNAREEAIILLDSINLCEAQLELKKVDSLLQKKPKSKAEQYSLKVQFDEACQKVKFYNRKINYDKKRRVIHKNK